MSRQAQPDRERLALVLLGQAEQDVAQKFVEAAETDARSPAALQLRAMNIIYETTKERDATILMPTAMVDSMNPGGAMGVVAAGPFALGNALSDGGKHDRACAAPPPQGTLPFQHHPMSTVVGRLAITRSWRVGRLWFLVLTDSLGRVHGLWRRRIARPRGARAVRRGRGARHRPQRGGGPMGVAVRQAVLAAMRRHPCRSRNEAGARAHRGPVGFRASSPGP